MRRIIVLSFITLDGVMQAPGGPEEDTSGGFRYGGWTAPYNDEDSGRIMEKQLTPADLLLGRKTFEIFASYWPEHASIWPGINDVRKYVLSSTLKKTDPIVTRWKNSVVITTPEDVQNLKRSDGPEISVWGSSGLVQFLLKHDLVDEFWLNIHPITLGQGKKLFNEGAIPAAFTLAESYVSKNGVIIANYRRDGEVRTGTVGA